MICGTPGVLYLHFDLIHSTLLDLVPNPAISMSPLKAQMTHTQEISWGCLRFSLPRLTLEPLYFRVTHEHTSGILETLFSCDLTTLNIFQISIYNPESLLIWWFASLLARTPWGISTPRLMDFLRFVHNATHPPLHSITLLQMGLSSEHQDIKWHKKESWRTSWAQTLPVLTHYSKRIGYCYCNNKL